MYDIIYDETGKLLSGVFYELAVHLGDELFAADFMEVDDSWIISRRVLTGEAQRKQQQDPWLRAEVLCDLQPTKSARRCPDDQSHPTEFFYGPYDADLFGGSRLSDFIPDTGVGMIVVTAEFAGRLRASGLQGMRFAPINVKVNQSNHQPDPKLVVLEFDGKNCLRFPKVVNALNECPFCSRKPLICPKCGYDPIRCPTCGKIPYVASHLHQGPQDRRLKFEARPSNGPLILEGSRWDGSDFVNGRGPKLVTRRAIDWLLSVHAVPFYAKPARVNVEGLDEQQMARIEAAKTLSSLKQ